MLYYLTIFDFWYSAYLFFGLGPFYLIWSKTTGFYTVFVDLGVIANFVFALVNQASRKTVTKVAFATTYELSHRFLMQIISRIFQSLGGIQVDRGLCILHDTNLLFNLNGEKNAIEKFENRTS